MKKLAIVLAVFAFNASAADLLSVEELRSCNERAIKIDRAIGELEAEKQRLDNKWSAIEIRRTFIETRRSMNDSFRGSPQYERETRAKFNADVDELNADIRALRAADRALEAAGKRYNDRLETFRDQCTGKSAARSTIEEVCGNSSSEYCQSFH